MRRETREMAQWGVGNLKKGRKYVVVTVGHMTGTDCGADQRTDEGRTHKVEDDERRNSPSKF